jgi:hypothetical protein
MFGVSAKGRGSPVFSIMKGDVLRVEVVMARGCDQLLFTGVHFIGIESQSGRESNGMVEEGVESLRCLPAKDDEKISFALTFLNCAWTTSDGVPAMLYFIAGGGGYVNLRAGVAVLMVTLLEFNRDERVAFNVIGATFSLFSALAGL